MTEPIPVHETPLRRYRADILMVGFLVGAMLLNIFAPIWLKPPRLALTSWLYVGLWFGWLPVYAWRRRRHTRPAATALFMIIGGIATCFVCMLLGPNLKSIYAVSFLDSIDCEEIELGGSRVRYECIRLDFEGGDDTDYYRLNLEGYDWLPIMWRVE